MAANKLHDIVISEINKIASNIKYREDLLTQNKSHINEASNQHRALLTKSLESNNLSQERILKAYESGALSLEEFGKAKGRLDNESLRLNEELQKIKKSIADTVTAKELKDKFINILKDFKKNFDKEDLHKQKNFMQNLIKSVIVKNNHVQINFHI